MESLKQKLEKVSNDFWSSSLISKDNFQDTKDHDCHTSPEDGCDVCSLEGNEI